jgi:hypothetical protein
MARRSEAEVTSFRNLGALALAVGWLFAGLASAEEPVKIPVKVLVTHVSNEGTGVEPEARGLHGHLERNQFSFNSVKVIHKKRVVLGLDEVHAIPLPNGRKARIQPISQRENSVLMAVDVEGSVRVDARVRRHKPFIIRAGKHNGGNLVLSLELDD